MTPIIINTKTDLHDTMTSIDSFDAVLKYDPVTKIFKLIVNGSFKDGEMYEKLLTLQFLNNH